MIVQEIKGNREAFLDILLIGDEDIKQVNRYINTGKLYGLYDNGLKTASLIIFNEKTMEIKNLATYPEYERLGYGSFMMNFLIDKYKDLYDDIILGTGDSGITEKFYEKFGFRYFYTKKDYFTDNYKEKIIENNKILKDMIYLKLKK